MGRGKKKNGGGLPNRELFQRMNFLYQSAQFLASTTTANSSNGSSDNGTNSSDAVAKCVADNRSLLPLARFFTKEMRQVARKSVLRLSPHIKRDLCKACGSPQQPGISCTVRVKGKGKSQRTITTCMYCGWQRRLFVAGSSDGQAQLFVDQPQHTTVN
ncbi:hypothetical protein IWW42_002770 [Coemansia sp. RSA 1085]|nr:hypothetical protein IWW42_002770 [Coemansia sp. RSA 1085]